MGKVDWRLKKGDPALSYFTVEFRQGTRGYEQYGKSHDFMNQPCYYPLWDYYEDCTALVLYHPYVKNVDENMEVVQHFLNIPALDGVFLTEFAKEGLAHGFRINPDTDLGLLKAAIISLRGIWEKGDQGARGHNNPHSTFVNEWKFFVDLGVPPEHAVLFPFRFHVRGSDIIPVDYQHHWMGFPSFVDVKNLFSESPELNLEELQGSRTCPVVKSQIPLKDLGIHQRTVFSFFGRRVRTQGVNKESIAVLYNKIMEGLT